jgi:DNA polymerase III psi subunit
LVESERQRLTEQIDREIQNLQIGRSSLDHLQRIEGLNTRSAQALEESIRLTRQAGQREERTQQLLERVLIHIRG